MLPPVDRKARPGGAAEASASEAGQRGGERQSAEGQHEGHPITWSETNQSKFEIQDRENQWFSQASVIAL